MEPCSFTSSPNSGQIKNDLVYDRYINSARVAAAGETPHFLVWWVLASLCRSQHICLFNESKEMMGVNVVNIGAVLQDL
jgi:hypothetical protein